MGRNSSSCQVRGLVILNYESLCNLSHCIVSATTTTDILEKAQRTINQLTSTKISLENPRLIKPQARYSTTTSHPPSLRANHVSSSKLPSSSTQQAIIPSSLSQEVQPCSNKSKSFPALRRVSREKQSAISTAVAVEKPQSSQENASQSKELLALHTLKTRFWKCEHCLSKFPQKWALQVHHCSCVVAKPYLCSNCGKAYISKDDVQTHASECGGGRQYKCGYCRRSFLNVNTLSKHLKIHLRKSVAGALKRKTMAPVYHRIVQ